MGLSFPTDITISGYRPTLFKNALGGYMRTHDLHKFLDLKSLFPTRRDAAIVYEECVDRGLIDPATSKVTPKGERIAAGKAKLKTKRERAYELLDQFLARVDAVNRNPDSIMIVKQVWLFGSLMRNEEIVGDIDLALEVERRPEFQKLVQQDHPAADAIVDAQVEQFPDAPRFGYAYAYQKEAWLLSRALYGKTRHHLYAGIQDHTHALTGNKFPCRLLYDLGRGGFVNDPILPHHPKWDGKKVALRQVTKMPRLTPSDLRPMDARWVIGFWSNDHFSPYQVFRSWTPEAEVFRVHRQHARELSVFTDDDDDKSRSRWLPARATAKGLDGRNFALLVNVTQPPFHSADNLDGGAKWGQRPPNDGVSVVLHRRITRTNKQWTLHVSLQDLEICRNKKQIDLSLASDLSAVAALIVGADAERMCRRASEARPKVKVVVEFDPNLDEPLRFMQDVVMDLLLERQVRCEPSGATPGSVQIVEPPRQVALNLNSENLTW